MKRKILRFSLWLLAGFGVLLLLILIGVGLYTRTDHFRLLLREQALTAVRTAIDGEVTFERVSGSVWKELVFHDLSLRQNGVEVIAAPQVAVTIDLLPQVYAFLRSSEFHIANLTLTNPMIRAIEDKEKGWNLARLLKTSDADQPEEPSALSIFIDQIKAEGGTVFVQQPQSEELRVTTLALDGNLAILPAGMQLELATLDFSLARAGVPEVRWTSALAYDDSESPSVVEVQKLDLRTAGSHLLMSGTLQDLSAPTVALTVEAEKLAAAELRTLAPTLPLQQDLSGSVRVTGPFSALQVAATLSAPDGNITTSVTANLTQTPPQYQGTLAVQRFVVDKVLQVAGLSGEMNGNLSFEWTTLESARGTLKAHASSLTTQGWHVDSVDLTGNLNAGQLAVTAEVKGKSGNAHLQSQVALSTPPAYEATVKVNNLDIAKVGGEGDAALAGRLNLDAWVKGRGTSLEELDGAAKLTLRPSQIGAITITQGRAAGSLRGGQLTLDEVMLLANDTTLTAQGKIGMAGKSSAAPNGKITYTVLSKNITPWLALADQKGTGGIDLRGTASGELTALRLEGKATLSNFQVATTSLQSGTVTYALTGVGGAQPRGQVTAALSGIDAAGTQLRTVKTDVTVAGLEPAEVQADLVVQDAAGRTHHLKTQAQYRPEHVQARVQELSLQLPSGVWRTPESAQLVMQGDALTIDDFRLQRANQTISIQGVIALQAGKKQDLRVRIDGLTLAELHPLVGESPEVSGQVAADARVQGTAAAPIIEVNINTDKLAVAGQTYADLTAHATYRQDRLDLNLLLRQDATHTLTVEGGVPVSLGWAGEGSAPVLGEANLRAHSDGLSLGFLGLLSKEVRDVQGTLSMDVRVRGPANALAPSGQIRLQQGQAQVIPLGLRLKDMELQVGLTPDAVQITQLSARAGDGRLTGSGKLALRQYTITDLALTLNADRFRVINTHEYVAAVSGRIVSSGSLQYPFIRGALTVQDARLRPDLALLQSGPAPPDPTIIVVEHAQAPTAPGQQAQPTQGQPDSRFTPPQPDLAPQLSLDVTVTVPRGTWVHMDDGSVELMGKVHIQKGPQEDMVLAGAIETVRGWYVFQRRKFRLERGRVVFTGGVPIDPGLEVVAVYTLPDYRVYVAVGGTASMPTLTLRSEPSLEQADILSLLAFGRPVDQLTGGEKASLQSQALQATVGYVASDLRRSVADKLGVENLEFDVGQNLADSKIGVGKQISGNVFISTSQQLGNKQEREVAIEYQLSPGWQFKTSSTSKGHHGVDLFWEKRY